LTAAAIHQRRKFGEIGIRERGLPKGGVLPEQQHICGLDRTSFGPKSATK
jgi:hypothetical protein